MLRRGHTGCGAASTLIAAWSAVCGYGTSWVQGQPPENQPTAEAPTGSPPIAWTESAIEPAEAMAVFRVISAWIREWSVPDAAPADQRPVPAALVTLRLGGEIVGRGLDAGGDAGTVWRATRAAVAEASGRLPVENDALAERQRRELAKTLGVSLEIAHPLVPITVATYDDADVALPPGLAGVAVRRGEVVEVSFPSAMVRAGLSAGDALAAAAGRALGDATKVVRLDQTAQPAALRQRENLVFYRFGVTHIAQGSASRAAVFLYRGGRVVPEAAIGRASIREHADEIARHLVARAWPGAEPLGMLGTYNPLQGRFDGPASALEQASAATALAAYARTPGVEPESAKAAAAIVARLAADMLALGPDETEPWKDATGACAALATAAAALELDPRADSPARELIRKASATAREGTPPEGLAAFRAFALTRAGAAVHDPVLIETGGTIARELVAQTPAGRMASHAPWLLWAELAAAGEGAGAGPIGSATAWREMRAQTFEHQLQPEDAGDDGQDLVGGIVFTVGRQPLPTWHSARPLSAAATMLGDRRLTPEAEYHAELARLLLSLRFLANLMAAGPEAHAYPSPAQAIGGVRASVWDHRMPVDASALTLLTLCETLRALEAAPTPRER